MTVVLWKFNIYGRLIEKIMVFMFCFVITGGACGYGSQVKLKPFRSKVSVGVQICSKEEEAVELAIRYIKMNNRISPS